MKNKIGNKILHEQVEDYCHNWLGVDDLSYYLHKEIDDEKERSNLYSEFLEFAGEEKDIKWKLV